MMRLLQPVAGLGLTMVLSLSAYYFSGDTGINPIFGVERSTEAAFGDYQFSELNMLRTTLFYLGERYVEPGRIHQEKMFISALSAVERRIPSCLFERAEGSGLLYVEVGDFQTTLQIPPITDNFALLRAMNQVASTLDGRIAVEDIPDRELGPAPYAQVEYALIKGMLSTLDPHSMLLTPEAGREMEMENQGHFGGLGVTINDRNGRLTVEYPMKNTPAMRAGLQPDDHIIRIEGESTINMGLDEAVTRLRGPVGAPVNIEVMRDGLTEALKIRIVRARIQIHPVEGSLLDGDIGYVHISSFHGEVASSLKEELSNLTKQSKEARLKGLVLDLRGNPGGFLGQAIYVSDQFLEAGVIVSTIDGSGRKLEEQRARAWGTSPNYPIVVLVNGRSASASEIVAGALRNNDRAIVVGERTFGKGSVQNLQSFADDSKLKVTTAQYLTPGDKSIQSVGISADIELIPTVVQPEDDDFEAHVLMFWRERALRESDMDLHLAQSNFRAEEPAYSLRYVRDESVKRRRTSELELESDVEVQFAKRLIQEAGSPHRAEMLAQVEPLVEAQAAIWDAELRVAVRETIDVDWALGPAVDKADLEVSLSIGSHDVLQAGQEEEVQLTVTNRGSASLYRLVAIGQSEMETLDGREFIFGRLNPGQTRTFSLKIHLVDGYPTEQTPVELVFRDVAETQVASYSAVVHVKTAPLPQLSWSWSLPDEGLQVGKAGRIALTVKNTGEGPSRAAFARLKNRSGRAIDLHHGTVEPGHYHRPDGSECVADQAGVIDGVVFGDVVDARVISEERPVFDEECERALLPGEEWTGFFEVELKEAADSYELLLGLGDGDSYDFGSIVRGGFWDYFTQEEEIQLKAGVSRTKSHHPPQIVISRRPDSAVDQALVTVSGTVTDETGLRYVLVYHDDEKVFYSGSQAPGLLEVPFTVEVELNPGLNTFSVLATDVDSDTQTASTVTLYSGGH